MMKISIDSKQYEIIDILSNIPIADCSVCRNNKIGRAHGERKIYLPGDIEEKNAFFDLFTGNIDGFLYKQNLIEYLEQAEKEYMNPTQQYRNKGELKKHYKKMLEKTKASEDIIKISVKKSEVTHSGIYINQNTGKKRDKNWNYIGDIALPRISRLSILKLKDNNKIVYYFKIGFGTEEQEAVRDEIEVSKCIEKVNNSKLSPTEKEVIIKARIGQGTYRQKLLNEVSICPFTLVDDEHLLVVSHIKPWKDAKNSEKKDPKNGFVFTPTYDKLFDRGYISFTDDKRLIISPWLSKYNQERLGLVADNKIDKLPEIDDKRKAYLKYHRENVLKRVEDL